MAPVNPEGQTARDTLWTLLEDVRREVFARMDGAELDRTLSLRLRVIDAIDLLAQPSEGQTAQEVRHLSRIPFTPWCGADEPNQHTTTIKARANCLACFRCALASDAQDVRHAAPEAWHAALERAACEAELHGDGLDGRELAEAIRALASTPSPIQTQSTKEEANGAGRIHEGGGEGHRGGSLGNLQGAAEVETDAIPRALERYQPVPDGGGKRGPGRDAEEEVAPSPAKQTEQKIASAEGGGADEARSPVADGGAASQLGAAPAAFDQFLAHLREHGIDEEGSCILCERWIGRVRDPDHAAAPAQPDARDAEIARLTKELEEARAAADRRQFTTDEAVRLLNIVLRALAPPEPKAETPAETAGQKEGRTTCRATVDFDPLEMCEPIECGNPMPCALHPAQPSQDVAGTSGESLAGLSKETK